MKPLINRFEYNKDSQNKVLIISSVHGDEVTPLRTVWLLNDYFKKEKISRFSKINSITTVMGANHIGIKNNERKIVPPNHKGDINRMFDEDYEYDAFEELKKLIDEHNIIIDIHSSSRINEFALVDIDGYADFILKWLKKSNVDYACRYAVSDGTIKKYALKNNKIGITIELNGLEKIDFASASKGEMMIINMIDNINFEMKEDFKIPYNIKYIDEMYEIEDIKAGYEGILLEKFQGGANVKRGTLLAEIVDYEFKTIREIVAKYDAFIVSFPSYHYVTPSSITYTLMRTK